MPETVARWQDWATEGLEHLVLREDSTGSLAESTVIGDADGERFAARYHIECDREWRARSVALSLIGRARAAVVLSTDGAGNWQDDSGPCWLLAARSTSISPPPRSRTRCLSGVLGSKQASRRTSWSPISMCRR